MKCILIYYSSRFFEKLIETYLIVGIVYKNMFEAHSDEIGVLNTYKYD